MAQVAMDSAGAVASAFQQTAQNLAECPGEEDLWYLLLRSAELGGTPYGVTVLGIEIDDLKSAADEVAKRWPRSAKIATIRARALGSVQAAMQAVSLDPSYVPAQTALGAALLRAGDAKAARGVLESAPSLERIPGGYALLARARLDTGDAEGAVQAAAKEPSSSPVDPIEPCIRDERPQRDAKEAAGLAHLAAKRYDKAARLLVEAAAAGSAAARASLEDARPELQHALIRLSNSAKLSAAEKSLLSDILKNRAQPTTTPE